MRVPEVIARVFAAIRFVETTFLAGALLGAILLAVTGVLFRYVLQAPLAWGGEVLQFLFVWIVFVGSSVAVRKRMHVSVDLISERLQPHVARGVQAAARAGFAVFIALLGWTGFQTVLLQLDSAEKSPALAFPMWIVSAAVPVGCVLMLLSLLAPPELDTEPVATP